MDLDFSEKPGFFGDQAPFNLEKHLLTHRSSVVLEQYCCTPTAWSIYLKIAILSIVLTAQLLLYALISAD
ncbi:MAG TPA: hypothetical protein DCY88_19920 [Cyanobacteria bacterium UBA11372]|nr:hypothetical protein [Cyanobacteria bacterium UBA11372]